LSDASARSGENSSPKRALEETNGVLCFNPRSGEGVMVWAKSDLAQARRSRPSESSQSAIISHSLRRESLA